MEVMITEGAYEIAKNGVTLRELANLQRIMRLIRDTEEIPLKNLLGGDGNSKIPRSTAIYNITSANDCPSMKLGLCAAKLQGCKCYALKSEYSYHPDVLPYRRKQAKLWEELTAVEFAKQFLVINFSRGTKFTALRLNVSGDFKNQKDVDKSEEIARILKLNGITVYTYSSRKDLNFSGCKNLILSGSNFTKAGVSNIFKIIEKKEDKPKGWLLCKGDCNICNRCQIRNQKICVLKH